MANTENKIQSFVVQSAVPGSDRPVDVRVNAEKLREKPARNGSLMIEGVNGGEVVATVFNAIGWRRD